MAKKPIKITEVVLRDAHQSLLATRMTMDEMRPILPEMDKIPYFSVECWGGATFDSCIRFLDEDPWERLRILRKELPHQKLQMLFRGQNMLGYRPYADDAVEYFVQKSVANGIDVIRIFDALNDPRNLKQAIDSTNKYNGICEVAMSYTVSPVHTEDYFVDLAVQFEKMGAQNICVKDMANLLLPYQAYSLIKKLKQALKKETLVHLHTHNTTGTGDMVNLKAIEAGVDIVDCALSPLANGTSQPATESLIATLQGTEYDTGIDLNELTKATEHFRKVAQKLQAEGILDPKVLRVDVNTLKYQVPGGMLSNLINQLKQAGKSDKLYEVLAEVPRVRKDFGYPPLVTPTSQIVGTQAVMNVIAGERYKMNPKESQGLMRGEYGKLPAPVNEEVRRKVIGNAKVITYRPADDLKPEMEKYRKECARWYTQEEDVLSYALFPQVAPKFFEYRQAEQLKLDNSVLDKKNNAMPV